MDGVGGMCGLWVVLCVGCVLHGLLIPSLCPHQTTTTLPFSSPFTTPLFCLCLCVEKGGGPESGWCGMECGVWHATHQPLCFHQAITNPCVSLVLHHSLLTLKLLLFLPPLLPLFVWTERVKDKCGTHHVKHTVHHIQSTPHSFHPITPLFNEHMVDWLVMHQNTFHPSMVVCPLLMHKPFPPHSCFAIPFHHSTHQPPLLFSFSLFPIPFPFTTLMPCHHSTLFHSIHVLIVMIERKHA